MGDNPLGRLRKAVDDRDHFSIEALTVRLDGYRGPQPLPVIAAGRRPLRPTGRVFTREVLVLSPSDLQQPGHVVIVPDPSGERVDLAKGLEILAARGVVDLLVEGGSTLATSFWEAGLVDHGVVYAAAALAGGSGRGVFNGAFRAIGDLQRIKIIGIERIGPDLRVDFEGAD